MTYQKPATLARAWRRLRWLFGVYLRPRHIATADTVNGRLSFDSKDRTLGRQLCVYGEFEYDGMLEAIATLKSLGYLPEKAGGRIIDVGGYVGMISIGFLKAGIFHQALALEPNPNNFSLLQRNIEQNNLQDMMHSRNVAVSDSRGRLAMELSHKNFGDHRIRSSAHQEDDFFRESDRQTIEIEAIPLDELYAEEPDIFSDVRLVWMDIQGHEGKFFKGAPQFFSQHPRLPVIMEFWPYGLRRSGMDKAEFCAIVKKLFDSVYVLGGSAQRQDISAMDRIYDQFDGPENGAHLLLIREH
jgi:FkbM family methyltransferase